jgi:hypothetical protein
MRAVPGPTRFFSRLLAAVRRASGAVYRALLLVLLGVVYALILPWFALAFRFSPRRARPRGWQRRDDAGLASLDRLRSLF